MGKMSKLRYSRDHIDKEIVEVICLQETKLEFVKK